MCQHFKEPLGELEGEGRRRRGGGEEEEEESMRT
jgi:hypothetical protein